MSFCMISKAASSRFSETLTKTCYMLAHTSSFVNTFLQIFTLSIFSRAAKRIARFFDFYAPRMKIFHIFYRTSARAAWKTKWRKAPQSLAFFTFKSQILSGAHPLQRRRFFHHRPPDKSRGSCLFYPACFMYLFLYIKYMRPPTSRIFVFFRANCAKEADEKCLA